MKKVLLFLTALLFSAVGAFGQQRTITGKVVSQDGSPIPFATVQIKGTTSGTTTNQNGSFTLEVPANAVLHISSIGYEAQDVQVGAQNQVVVRLLPTAQNLKEIVVTALGIERNKNELPYAAQQVSGDQVTNTRSDNFLSALSGKVAGLQIKSNNNLGGSTNIVLRGYKSITGNNQALIVIDGVPVDNSNYNSSSQQNGFAGYDYGNTGTDINPDDIASINVLKGAAATALYGSRAANGVILITTKKGKKGLGITFNIGGATGSMDKSTWPKYQHEYGAGYFDPDYYPYSDAPPSPDPHFLYEKVNGQYALVVPTTEDASFGAKFDPNLLVYQWDAFDPTSPNFGKPTPWVAAKNDPTTFFETPYSYNTSVFVQGGDDKQTFKLGYTRTGDKGILPNSHLTKDMVDFSSTYNITSRLKATASINYTKENAIGRYGSGYDAYNPATNFREWWEMNVDIKEQKAAYFRTLKNITWNMTDPVGGDIGPIYWDNQYFVRYQNYESDSRNRYFGYLMLNYDPTSWLSLMGRVSLDQYAGLQEERGNVGSVNVPYYSRYNNNFKEFNYDFLANFNKDLSSRLNLKALLGANLRRTYFNSIYASTNGGLVIPGLYALSNSLNPINAPSETDEQIEVGGVFGGITLTYNNFLILDATARQDQSSTLPATKNKYFYPSISGGFIFSQLLKNVTWLSFGKLRLNYAEVGNDAPWAFISDVYDKPTPYGSVALFSVPNRKNNAELKPERTRSYEGGVNLGFLNNRISVDVTYFKTNTINQIINISIPAETGYTSKVINAGNVENKGWEVTLNLIPVKTNSFSWNMDINWARYRNKVISLYSGVQNIQIGAFQGGVSLNATVGQPFGVLKGKDFVYLNGRPVVESNGYYQITASTDNIIGDINPDWTGGISNTFTYKNFRLNFLIDIKQGGDLFSIDQWYGQGTGLYIESVAKNANGKSIRDPVDQGGGYIFPGVTADGKENTKYAAITGLRGFGYLNMPNKAYIFDASYIKLREVNLTYSLPETLVSHMHPFKTIDVSVYGHNLWIIHKNLPYADPEEGPSSGNIQGFQVGSYPTYRMYGFNLKFTF